MSIKHLHEAFIQSMKHELPEWKFIASNRHFRKPFHSGNWFFHLAFVNHPKDFDVVAEVAVEFLQGKNRICIVGAGLGSIEKVGQVRYPVSSEREAMAASLAARAHLERVGIPFLERYSDPAIVLSCLREGGPEARLLSPIQQVREQEAEALAKFIGAV